MLIKILGGKYKGRNFYMPAEIRPTQNMAREAIFDLIGHDLSGIEFLELFAGSGAVGLDALSRGAKKVTFVEKSFKCAQVIEENLRILGIDMHVPEPQAEVISLDAFVVIKRLAQQKRTFDVIFLDPPYGKGLVKKALKTLFAYDILAPKSIVVIEYSTGEALPELIGRFSIVKHKKYGKSHLTICERSP